MSSNLHKAARCFIATINNQLVGFSAIIHFPHSKVKNFKRVTRLVVLPDFQGIGIGNKLLNFVGNFYKKNGFKFIITTSTPALINYFKNSKNWIIKRFSRVKEHQGLRTEKFGSVNKYTISAEKIS